MANYASHAIMSELLFNKLNNKNKFRIKINKNDMKLFSFGQDLTALYKKCFENAHKVNSKVFFINTIKYIKENNLQNNSDIMAYLYGHIAHYTLDTTIHSFVNNLVDGIDKEAFLTPHTAIECDLDIYLTNKFKNNNNYFNIQPLLKKDMRKMIDFTYADVYSYFNVSNTYLKFVLFINIGNIFVNMFYKSQFIFKMFTGKDKYNNNPYFYNCLNKDNYLEKKYLKLLNESIKKAERMIKYSNKYLYDNASELYLDLIFSNAPYNGRKIESGNSIFAKIPILSEIKIK